jgi:hypothetical protein
MATTRNLEERIRELAEELSREFGQIEEQPGECLMSQVEEFATRLGDALASRVMEQELSSREVETDRQCPVCQRPGRLKRRRTRVVQTRRGTIEIREPEFYCSHCRKSFFPGVETTGDVA